MRHVLVFFILFAAALPLQGCKKNESFLDIQEVQSKTGIKAWLVEDHSVPVIALKFSFHGAGAVHDPADKQGLARLASNTMDEGAGDLDSQTFQKELQDKAISLSFSTSRDHFGGSVKTLTKNKERAFDLLHLALTEPRFDEEPVQRMRRANQSRIRSSLSDPEWMTARILNDVAFAGHPYAQNSGGTLSTLENITIDDLRNFVQTLSKDRLFVSVAGDITAEELSEILDTVFADLPEKSEIPSAPSLELQNKGQVFLYKQDVPQTVIEIIQPGIDNHDPDYQAAQIMNFVLGSAGFGSRLTKEIREERGLVYGIFTYLYDMEKFNGLAVSTSTRSAGAKEVLSLIKQEWQKMRERGISEEELKNAKSYLIGSLPLSLTSTDAIASILLSLQLDNFPIDYLDTREEKINAVSTKNVQRVAMKILDPGAFVTVLVGMPENVEPTKIVEELPNVE